MILENINSKTAYKQYENCVSLGCYCGCASSLSKLGMRSTSGPFDWYFSELWGVQKQIENAFNDFMKKENLKESEDDSKTFIDVKYGFCCPHEIQESFEDEIDEICSKYQKRATRFLNMIIKPTLFVRVVRDNKEVEYINNNWLQTQQIIRKYNNKNDIIYVIRKGLNKLNEDVLCFYLETDEYRGRTYEMRHLFNTSNKLIDFLSSTVSNENIKKNLMFDKNKYSQKINLGYVDKCFDENLDEIEKAILEGFKITKADPFYLWGAGEYGIRLANYLINRDVNILGIIDNSYSAEVSKNGLPINGFDTTKNYLRIFIAIASEKANEEIIRQINNSNKDISILKFSDLSFNADL